MVSQPSGNCPEWSWTDPPCPHTDLNGPTVQLVQTAHSGLRWSSTPLTVHRQASRTGSGWDVGHSPGSSTHIPWPRLDWCGPAGRLWLFAPSPHPGVCSTPSLPATVVCDWCGCGTYTAGPSGSIILSAQFYDVHSCSGGTYTWQWLPH